MALPSAADVALKLYNFNLSRNASRLAQIATDTQREQAQALLAPALALCADIAETVAFFYRHDPDPASRRVKEEHWGVVFESTAEPDAPPVP